MNFILMTIEAISSHSELAYAAVFVLAFLESVPVVGSIIPGSALIIGISTLIPSGAIRMSPLLAAAILGAVLGDGLPYWIGHRYRSGILNHWPLVRHPGLVEKSRAFLQRHGGKSIFLARFTPGVRSFVPIIAGVANMPVGKFYTMNILSAIIWAPAHILPGMLLGASVAQAGAATGRLMILLFLLAALFWILIAAARIAICRGPPLLEAGVARVSQWAFSRNTWLARQIRTVVDPERSEIRVLLLWSVVVIFAAWLFFAVLQDVVSGKPLVRVDAFVYKLLQGIRTPTGDSLMVAITELGDAFVVILVAIAVFCWLAFERAWRAALYWAAGIGFASVLNTSIKLIIHRPRPDELVYSGLSAFSFPSGHSTVNAVMYGFLIFLVARRLRPALQLPAFATAWAFAILISFSRLYLGATWFSDVIASLVFAAAWTIVLCVAYVYHRDKSFNRKRLSAVAFATLVVFGSCHILRSHEADMQKYAIQYEIPSMQASNWEKGGWRQLPAYRIDITGEMKEPLTLQWAGSLDKLWKKLQKTGWHKAEPWTLSNAMAWLVVANPKKLPVVPLFNAGRLPSSTFVRAEGTHKKTRVVLRIWPAELDLQNSRSYPLWIGSVVEERISRPLSFISLTETLPDFNEPVEVLKKTMKGAQSVRRKITTTEWNGEVLLAEENPFEIH